MRRLPQIVGAVVLFASPAARAEFQISAYGGANTANNSDVTLNTPLVNGTFDVDWFGDSFEAPPYWGIRGAWWLNDFNLPRWGVAIDYTHAKVKADLDDPDLHGRFSTLELTNGLNTATLNALYRAPLGHRFTLYGGAGAGVALRICVQSNWTSGLCSSRRRMASSSIADRPTRTPGGVRNQ